MKQRPFEKTLAQTLKYKLVGARKKYFVTEAIMPKDSRKAYEGRLVDLDDESQEVEDIIGDIAADGGIGSNEFEQARLDNLKARTKLIEEKLETRKQELWSEWNEAFFETFTEAFAKFKNELISLHLEEAQLSILTAKLESALKIMQDRLDRMWSEFNNEQEEEQGAEK